MNLLQSSQHLHISYVLKDSYGLNLCLNICILCLTPCTMQFFFGSVETYSQVLDFHSLLLQSFFWISSTSGSSCTLVSAPSKWPWNGLRPPYLRSSFLIQKGNYPNNLGTHTIEKLLQDSRKHHYLRFWKPSWVFASNSHDVRNNIQQPFFLLPNIRVTFPWTTITLYHIVEYIICTFPETI